MRQVHAHYVGSGYSKHVPAREIMEWNLIEEFHWTPQQIAQIPYKKLQKLFIVRNQKYTTQETKANLEKFKQQNQSVGRGQVRRYTREV
jgi:hypothetical protein